MDRLLIAVLLFVVVLAIGFPFIRMMGQPTPEPPPAGEMRRVNLRYRCVICTSEVKMMLAADELPDPPRHCQEDMELVAPPIE